MPTIWVSHAHHMGFTCTQHRVIPLSEDIQVFPETIAKCYSTSQDQITFLLLLHQKSSFLCHDCLNMDHYAILKHNFEDLVVLSLLRYCFSLNEVLGHTVDLNMMHCGKEKVTNFLLKLPLGWEWAPKGVGGKRKRRNQHRKNNRKYGIFLYVCT